MVLAFRNVHRGCRNKIIKIGRTEFMYHLLKIWNFCLLRLLWSVSNPDPVSSYNFAMLHSLLGEGDQLISIQ